MKKRKTRRSRCANETCGKQFRHADPAAKACSSNCKQVLYRHRRKAKEEAEKERERKEQRTRFIANFRKQRALEEAERQAAEAEVELDDDSPAFERWEAVGDCSFREMPRVDIRPCPGHTTGLLN
jgi:hypothetical protein